MIFASKDSHDKGCPFRSPCVVFPTKASIINKCKKIGPLFQVFQNAQQLGFYFTSILFFVKLRELSTDYKTVSGEFYSFLILLVPLMNEIWKPNIIFSISNTTIVIFDSTYSHILFDPCYFFIFFDYILVVLRNNFMLPFCKYKGENRKSDLQKTLTPI